MSRAALLARARIAAERGMVDTCRIRRRTGSTTDRTTGEITATYLDPDPYTGPCRVQQASATAGDAQVGEATVLVVGRVLQLPVVASAAVRADDEVTFPAVAASSDPALLSKQFTVKAEFGKTDASSRRLGIEEVTS